MIELIQGDAVVPEVHQNEYELIVKYMHGDADAYSSETFFYGWKEKDELLEDLRILAFMAKRGGYDSNTRTQRQSLEAFLQDSKKADAFSDYFIQHDTTDQSYGNNASIEGIQVFYYDFDRVKYKMTVKEDGKEL